MSKTIAIIIITIVFGIQHLHAQTGDSLSIKNKQKIEAIKNRINKAENTVNGNTALAEENEQLKLKVKQQQDSIIILKAIIKALKENQSIPKTENNNSKQCAKLYYKSYQTSIDYSANKQLDSIANVCLNNPKVKIKLIGYADKYGNEDYNLQLSKRRAMSVQKYFISKKKIPAENIEITGRGSLKGESASPTQSLNRRVEVYLY